MRYERGNVVLAVETIDGFGKNPGLWVGTKDPNTLMKVASFGSYDKATVFCKWMDYMFGMNEDEGRVGLTMTGEEDGTNDER